jgi:hypothetical protein
MGARILAAPNKFIIRTSDRGQFRGCREKWNFGSKIRQDWTLLAGIEALDFGSAIHQGLETYYDPLRWDDDRGVVEYETFLSFMRYLEEWKLRIQAADEWGPDSKEMWDGYVALGRGMLEHYFTWAPKHDKLWRPVKSEIEFEIQIPVPKELMRLVNERELLTMEAFEGVYYLYMWSNEKEDWVPVVYQGRIDLIAEHLETGKYIIIDHKTAAQFGMTAHLHRDVQVGSYAWAVAKMLNLDVREIVYNELKKSVPHAPRMLQKGGLSVAKNQLVTYQTYMAEIQRLGLNPAHYREFLDFLKFREANFDEETYFRRTVVSRTPAQLERTEYAICAEAIDMLSDPLIYPNPDRWRCNGCEFDAPCMQRQEGGDEQWFLKNSGLYIRRKDLPAKLRELEAARGIHG